MREGTERRHVYMGTVNPDPVWCTVGFIYFWSEILRCILTPVRYQGGCNIDFDRLKSKSQVDVWFLQGYIN